MLNWIASVIPYAPFKKNLVKLGSIDTSASAENDTCPFGRLLVLNVEKIPLGANGLRPDISNPKALPQENISMTIRGIRYFFIDKTYQKKRNTVNEIRTSLIILSLTKRALENIINRYSSPATLSRVLCLGITGGLYGRCIRGYNIHLG
jgi:hypothetical protein